MEATAMKKKKEKKEVTREDIQKALEKFNKAGGLIKKLPSLHAPSRVMAAGKAIHENVQALLAMMDYAG